MLTLNALDNIRLTLDSLFSSDEDFWLIIVDNGSESETIAFLKEVAQQRNNVELQLHPQNLGVWRGRYHALQHVETEFVGTIDSDLFFPKNWLTPLEYDLQSESVGQVGPLKLSFNLIHPYSKKNLALDWKTCRTTKKKPVEQLALFTRGHKFDKFTRDLIGANLGAQIEIEIPTRSISGCAMLTHTRLYTDPTLNDATYGQTNYGFEDLDYSWSLHFAGYRVRKIKSIYVHHFEHASIGLDQSKIRKESRLNVLYFAAKWEDQLAEWIHSKLQEGIDIDEIKKKGIFQILLSYPYTELPQRLQRLLV